MDGWMIGVAAKTRRQKTCCPLEITGAVLHSLAAVGRVVPRTSRTILIGLPLQLNLKKTTSPRRGCFFAREISSGLFGSKLHRIHEC